MFFKCIAFVGVCSMSTALNAWVVNVDCNEGVDGEKVAQSSALNHFTDATGATEYSSEQSVEGGLSCKFKIKKGSDGWGKWGGRKILPTVLEKGDELWMRVHTFFPADFDYNVTGAGNKLKFLRAHTRSTISGQGGSCVPANEGYNDWYIYPDTQEFGDTPYGFIKECHNVWQEFGSFNEGMYIHREVWETYEMYIKLDNIPSASGGEALVRVWRNNDLLGEFTSVPTLVTAESFVDAFLIFTYWNGRSPKTQHMYIDDLVVTNETPTSVDSEGNPRVGVGELLPSNPPNKTVADITQKVDE